MHHPDLEHIDWEIGECLTLSTPILFLFSIGVKLFLGDFFFNSLAQRKPAPNASMPDAG